MKKTEKIDVIIKIKNLSFDELINPMDELPPTIKYFIPELKNMFKKNLYEVTIIDCCNEKKKIQEL